MLYFVVIPGNFSSNENTNIPHYLIYAIFSAGLWAGIGDIVNGRENDVIIQYRLISSNHLLTGGNFGVEVALPAIATYICACVFLLTVKSFNNFTKNI